VDPRVIHAACIVPQLSNFKIEFSLSLQGGVATTLQVANEVRCPRLMIVGKIIVYASSWNWV